MKLAGKLLLPTLLTALVATAGGGVMGAVAQRNARESGRRADESMRQMETVTGVRERMGRLHTGVYRTMVLMGSMDEAAVKRVRDGLPREAAEVAGIIHRMAAGHPAAAGAATAVDRALGAYVKEADQALDLASVDPNTGVVALREADARFQDVTGATATLVDGLRNAERVAREEMAAASWRITVGLGLLSLLATAAVVLGSARVLRRIATALQQASGLAEAVANGDLSRTPVVTRRDEIGRLQSHLARMVVQLRGSLQAVRQAADGTACASGQIAAGNQDLSDRTEQTAARLQQATASMADLREAVGLTAEATVQARTLAGTTSSTAERSGAMVGQIVEHMADLTQSSQRIGDIVGTIDAIAFQTNLLALNAAVEAARAGEQGRGFAVVAGEVRALAQRSAGAAREIKVLIGNSVDKVEHGATMVREAGSTMVELVAAVRRVSAIIGDISDRAGDQRQGLDRVHEAVDELDRMTQQNAALVEQSAAAAAAMREQAQNLASVVAQFQLQDEVVQDA